MRGGGVRTKFLFVLLLKPAFAADTGQVRATLGQSAMKGKAALAWGGGGRGEQVAGALRPAGCLHPFPSLGLRASPESRFLRRGPSPFAPTSLSQVQLGRGFCRYALDPLTVSKRDMFWWILGDVLGRPSARREHQQRGAT